MKNILFLSPVLCFIALSSCEIKPKPGVYCDKPADCSAEKPNCDLEFNNCYSCKTINRCPSTVCQSDGKCAEESTVVYVDNKNGTCTGASHGGTKSDPVCKISDGIVKALSMPGKTTVYLIGSSAPYDSIDFVATVNSSLTILGPGKEASPAVTFLGVNSPAIKLDTKDKEVALSLTGIQIVGSSTDPGFSCLQPSGTTGKATVTFTDVAIRDAGKNGNTPVDGITSATKCAIVIQQADIYGNTGAGITSSGSLTLQQANIYGNTGAGITSSGSLTLQQANIYGNTVGGVKIEGGQYTIKNSIINLNKGQGGSIDASAIGTFLFNTLVKNGKAGQAGGIDCGNDSSKIKLIENSIIWGNLLDVDTQFGSKCQLSQVVVGNDSVSKGTAISKQDPAFVNDTDFHLKSGEQKNLDCCVDKVASAPGIDVDFDGSKRPKGKSFDIGAHEVQ